MAAAAIVSQEEKALDDNNPLNVGYFDGSMGSLSTEMGDNCSSDDECLSSDENKIMLQILMDNFDIHKNGTRGKRRKHKQEDNGAPVSRERVEKELNDALHSIHNIPISKQMLDKVCKLVNDKKTTIN